jgi:hypothetical protein
MDESKPKKIPGTGPGTGRAHGSKNLAVGEVKREIRAFFQELMIDSMRWRRNVKMHLEEAPDPREFRFWSTIALSYRFGVPGKMAPEGVERAPMVFATTHGYQSWDPRAPGAAEMNARSQRMIEAKAEEIKVQAETREAEKVVVVIEAKADNDTDGEALESVTPPPEPPEAFGRGR